MNSPYTGRPPRSFWRSGVSEAHPLTIEDLYRKKFSIGKKDKIATAGSCFAQHVSNYLQNNRFCVLDVEPPPPVLSEDVAKSFGYKIYSARYGNIYTIRQLLQLAQDAEEGRVNATDVWEKDGRYFDALRPNIEPQGFDSVEETLALRKYHLAKVKELFTQMDVFIFTLGLTEAWIDTRNDRVFPTAPGTIAGEYDPEIHAFRNFGYNEIYDDFIAFLDLVRDWNPDFKVILTVSPVPLTATESDDHVLLATTYSKSVLRSVAGELARKHDFIDYFPSYELIASPWSKGFFYDANMRSVNMGGVASVMRIFFDEHSKTRGSGVDAADGDRLARRLRGKTQSAEGEQDESRRSRRKKRRKKKRASSADAPKSAEDVICEELLLEAFAP